MPMQLEQTLYTLSAQYQRGVSVDDYEVVVVENDSTNMTSEGYVHQLGKNIHYYSRKERSHSPVPAINFAFEQCRGKLIGLMIDGAHMVTPRVVQYALTANRAFEKPIVVVPGYHVGGRRQSTDPSYNETVEQEVLAGLQWRENGYELFDVAEFSPGNEHSYLHPIMECNCLFAPYKLFKEIGFCDTRFMLKGGGSVNLHLYRQLATKSGTTIVVLPGEGSFHQFHGGVSTSSYEQKQQELSEHRKQLHEIWGGSFHSVSREPVLLGAVTHWAQRFLELSSHKAQKRYRRLASLGRQEWEDDDALTKTDAS